MLTPRPFYYLRHGETDWNRDRRLQGQSDVPLNARGLAQAQAARDLLAGHPIGTVCCSPLRRAHETALIVNEGLGRPLVVLDELKEMGLGPYEGELPGAWYAGWQRGDDLPGAEPFSGFVARALRGINAALEQAGPVLIVAHGGVYWAIERHARIVRERGVPNGVPLVHEPPTGDHPWWRMRPLAAAAASAGILAGGAAATPCDGC